MQLLTRAVDPVTRLPGKQEAAYRRTGALFENFSRVGSGLGNGAVSAEKRILACGIWLPAGLTIATLACSSGTTPFAVGTGASNRWFCLYRPGLQLLGVTVEDGGNAWAANTEKPLAIGQFWNGAAFVAQGSVVTQEEGLHYFGQMQQTGASAPGTMASQMTSGGQAGNLGLAPILVNNANTVAGAFGPTDCPTTLALSTNVGFIPWVWVG